MLCETVFALAYVPKLSHIVLSGRSLLGRDPLFVNLVTTGTPLEEFSLDTLSLFSVKPLSPLLGKLREEASLLQIASLVKKFGMLSCR